MRARFVLLVSIVATVLASCSSSGGSSRTIEVDYRSDDFAGTFRGYFPRDVTVRPGMTLKFHQTWSGEPHTVTMGTEVSARVDPLMPLILKDGIREPSDDEIAAAGLQAAGDKFGELPFFFGDKGINQAAGQPCFLDTGLPKGQAACRQRVQPAFTGRQSYYSSGFIPYLGEQGNSFTMKIADNAKPGTYVYYCSLHGPAMSGRITVSKTAAVASQSELNRKARDEAGRLAKPLLAQLKKELAGKGDFKGNLAGSGTDSLLGVLGQVNEFTPRTVRAKVGQPVTWTFIQNHTISFNVPAYVPYYAVKANGTVVQSESIYAPRGGWPGRSVPTPEDGPPLPLEHVDAGKFDGSGGLRSSGVDWETGDTYTVTFTKAGTYPMACLVHPGMIGKVVVS